jgi:hypothetical protein
MNILWIIKHPVTYEYIGESSLIAPSEYTLSKQLSGLERGTDHLLLVP